MIVEATLFILSVSCFIVSFHLGNIYNRLNKIEKLIYKIERDIDQMRE